MEDFIITLKTYESTLEAMVDRDILRANDIECFINNEQLVELYPTFKGIDEGLKIVVFEKDFERALKLLTEVKHAPIGGKSTNHQTENEIVENHYLYSFSDKDIIDVLANPVDWSKEELSIANLIIQKRGLKITADAIRQARMIKNEQTRAVSNSPNRMYLWFLLIGYLSILNTIFLFIKSNVHFIFGLAVTQIIDTVSFSKLENYKILAFIISFLISGIFVAIGYFAKALQKWAYLTGLVLYGLDTSIFIYTNDWLSSSFHIIILIAIVNGTIKLYPAATKTSGN